MFYYGKKKRNKTGSDPWLLWLVVTSKLRVCWLSHCAGSGCWRRNKI